MIRLLLLPLIIVILLFAAFMEVYGDDRIRNGFEGKIGLVFFGGVILFAYGLAVNTVNLVFKQLGLGQWSLSALLGIYVGFFAVMSLVWDKRALHHWSLREFVNHISIRVLIGIVLIFVGGLIVQWGDALWIYSVKIRDHLQRH